ncbi:hypothetical protein [Motiliproteus sp. SC1-56]|uniref:hypothetical protein n=1 Tax=Motiliproteus sp. SC1-56 TaxID=2799565 RepID=UPI001A8D68BC|nr:hypothetical protein [Motiliproteus sp. SC1-56]
MYQAVARQPAAPLLTPRVRDQDVALDIDPLALRVRVEGREHHFNDRIAMEAFLRKFWERAIQG